MINRRMLLKALVAPAIIRIPGLLMPIKPLIHRSIDLGSDDRTAVVLFQNVPLEDFKMVPRITSAELEKMLSIKLTGYLIGELNEAFLFGDK